MRELSNFPGYFVTEDGQIFSERTRSENMKHAVRTGLWTPPTDEQYRKNRATNGMRRALFSLEEASDIMEMKDVLKLTFRELAKIVGCNRTSLQRIANGKQTCFINGVLV